MQNRKISREAPAAPTRGRDRVGRGGLEGVDHPLHGWGCLRGRGFALPLHGESMRGGKRRLQELLNAGPFSMVTGLRDEDQYGRKLRMVTRDGRSIGEVLVGEGLARRWEGSRRSWCD